MGPIRADEPQEGANNGTQHQLQDIKVPGGPPQSRVTSIRVGQVEEPSNTTTSQDQDGQAPPARVYITGWRLHLLTLGLCLSLLLSTLETTIVSTSLVSITNALGGFGERDWVVTSYFITYAGFLVIFSKFSDILGRKVILLLALGLFTVFSIVCGSISSMLQLIIFRAFQGMGGSGINSMVSIITPEMVPPEKWALYIAIISIVSVISSVLGPLLGGVINNTSSSSWHWVFLLNAPAGVIATALIAFILPAQFPNHRPNSPRVQLRDMFNKSCFSRLDYIGATFLLSATILVVFAFEEAGSKYPWGSAIVISTLVISVVLFVAFFLWEYVIVRQNSVQEPVFPLRLMKSRLFSGMILVAFMAGPPFMTVLINLPQRIQAVNGKSPLDAGIQMLPLLLSSPFATAVAGQLVSKLRVPPFFILLGGAIIQTVGVGLTSSLGVSGSKILYGYEVIVGVGFGTVLVALLVYAPLIVSPADLAVTIGSLTQVRMLGGTIGLAISSTILNNYLEKHLPPLLSQDQIESLSQSLQFINELQEPTRGAVREVFSNAYNAQLHAMMVFSGVFLLSVAVLYERKPRGLKDIHRGY